jgi:hypothetical protein
MGKLQIARAVAGFIFKEWLGLFFVQNWWSMAGIHPTSITNQATPEGPGAAIVTREIDF